MTKNEEYFEQLKPEYEKYYRLYNGDEKANNLAISYKGGFVIFRRKLDNDQEFPVDRYRVDRFAMMLNTLRMMYHAKEEHLKKQKEEQEILGGITRLEFNKCVEALKVVAKTFGKREDVLVYHMGIVGLIPPKILSELQKTFENK